MSRLDRSVVGRLKGKKLLISLSIYHAGAARLIQIATGSHGRRFLGNLVFWSVDSVARSVHCVVFVVGAFGKRSLEFEQ